MANEEHLAILRQGVEVWDAWREEHPDVQPDLTGADLTGADLSEMDLNRVHLREANLNWARLRDADLNWADLNWTDFSNTDLRGTDLHEADFSRANLRGANLNRAYLNGANLRGANLQEADLTEAEITAVNFTGANLSKANLSRAITAHTIFADIDFSATTGLDTIQHRGPSTLGIDTLYLSQGKIPEAFLCGCGVPNALIEYLPSLLGAMQPIQFYSCFISYSSKDEDFARRLHERMQAAHLRVWFAPEDIKGGEKLHEQIERAIQMHDRLLLVLSEESMQSEWVQQELRRARRSEIQSQRRKLFPIRLLDFEALQAWECPDSRTGSDLAEEVRQYFIPDFSRWKDHDAFERAFTRLLRDLKAVDAPPAPAPANPTCKASGQSAPTRDRAALDNPAAIIAIKRRRFQILEEQRALKGSSTPPEVIIEIEDLRRDIAELGGE